MPLSKQHGYALRFSSLLWVSNLRTRSFKELARFFLLALRSPSLPVEVGKISVKKDIQRAEQCDLVGMSGENVIFVNINRRTHQKKTATIFFYF